MIPWVRFQRRVWGKKIVFSVGATKFSPFSIMIKVTTKLCEIHSTYMNRILVLHTFIYNWGDKVNMMEINIMYLNWLWNVAALQSDTPASPPPFTYIFVYPHTLATALLFNTGAKLRCERGEWVIDLACGEKLSFWMLYELHWTFKSSWTRRFSFFSSPQPCSLLSFYKDLSFRRYTNQNVSMSTSFTMCHTTGRETDGMSA